MHDSKNLNQLEINVSRSKMMELRFCRPPISATTEGLKKEIFIKASLLTEGINFDESALEGIRSTDTDPSEWLYKEQSHWLFD